MNVMQVTGNAEQLLMCGIMFEEEVEDTTPKCPANSFANIFIENCLLRREEQVLSPIIFSKKLNNSRLDRKAPAKIMIFETLLITVAKCYYKSNYDILAFLRDINTNFLEETFNSTAETEKAFKKGRTHKIKKVAKQKPKSYVVTKENSLAGDEKETQTTQDLLVDDANMLDYLISPLKEDFEFGGLIRNLADQGNGDLRMRNLCLWKAIRNDCAVRWLNSSRIKACTTSSAFTTCGSSLPTTASGNFTSAFSKRTRVLYGTNN